MVVAGIDLQDGAGTKYRLYRAGPAPFARRKIPAPLYADFDLEGSGLRQVPTIGNLVVDEKFRRKGIAKAMLKESIETAASWATRHHLCRRPHQPRCHQSVRRRRLLPRLHRQDGVQVNVLQTCETSAYTRVERASDTTAQERKERV